MRKIGQVVMVEYNGKFVSLRSLAKPFCCGVSTIRKFYHLAGCPDVITDDFVALVKKCRTKASITVDGNAMHHRDILKKFKVGTKTLQSIVGKHGKTLTSDMFPNIKKKTTKDRAFAPIANSRERKALERIKGPSSWELANLDPKYIGSRSEGTSYGIASGMLPAQTSY